MRPLSWWPSRLPGACHLDARWAVVMNRLRSRCGTRNAGLRLVMGPETIEFSSVLVPWAPPYRPRQGLRLVRRSDLLELPLDCLFGLGVRRALAGRFAAVL